MLATDAMGGDQVRTSMRILLADDDDIIRTVLGRLLERQGHSVRVVSNGQEAVDSAAANEYDLVLLDLRMPRMGGAEAARMLRQASVGGHRPRIVGISADADSRTEAECAGMDDFLPKPVRLADLERVIWAHTAV